IQNLLPDKMPSWGKVRIVDGDSIRSMSACGDESTMETLRDMSFVRVPYLLFFLFYGRLEEILVCPLPEKPVFREMSNTTRLLAVITPCVTAGKDASKEWTAYTRMTTPIVTDLATIVAVVGRAFTRGDFVFVDRSGGLLHPEFQSA
ncbi:hypothetical protein C8R43DRAFT_873817, partial [Mycena crocata]